MSRLAVQFRNVIKSVLLDKRLFSYFMLLLALHLLGSFLIYELIPEFDIVTHFFFGYMLSEYASKSADSIGLHEFLTEKLHRYRWLTKTSRRIDLLIRFAAFFLIGGLFWESAELLGSPLIGRSADPFFISPITLHNIDGALDVTIGAIGTAVAGIKNKILNLSKRE